MRGLPRERYKLVVASTIAAMVTALFPAVSFAELIRQRVEYTHGDLTCRGYLVYDDAEVSSDHPAPGVLVVPEWWGLNRYAMERADQLAELGYVAFAADMYGVNDDGEVRVTTDGGQAQQWATALYSDAELWRARGNAALDVLAAQPVVDSGRLGAIGFCFGGATVQQLAYSGADFDAVVSFHGTPIVPSEEDRDRCRAAVLICHGAADPFDPLDELRTAVDALEASDIDYQVVLYGHAVHSFTNPAADGSFHPGAKHSPTAEPRAWAAMKRWFREHFAE